MVTLLVDSLTADLAATTRHWAEKDREPFENISRRSRIMQDMQMENI